MKSHSSGHAPGENTPLEHGHFCFVPNLSNAFAIHPHISKARNTRFLNVSLYPRFLDVIMTTLAHMSASLRRLRVQGWTSLVEKHTSIGDQTLPANTSAKHSNEFPRNATQSKTNVETRNAAEELAVAALIHSRLMSIRLPDVSYACLKGKTVPCRTIGGDFFDAIALSDALCAVVADVSGKGVAAAIVAAMLQGIIHAQMLADQPLTAIAGMVNEFLCSRATGKFATMVLLKVRANGTAEYVNCGHVPPVLVNSASVRRLEGSNLVVGLVRTAKYRSETCELMTGDRVLIFTDGITEAENARGEEFGASVLECRNHLCSLESIFENAEKFHGSQERCDDWTLFELLYRGGEPFVVCPS